MINFVSKEETDLVQIARVRKLVVMITTVTLVVYLVATAGYVGWIWYWSGKEQRTSVQAEELTRQIAGLADAEAAARKLGARAADVSNFLATAGGASEAANFFIEDQNVYVISWNFSADGSQSVEVSAPAPAQIKEFATLMEKYYGRVQPDRIMWMPEQGWQGRLLLSERKGASQ